MVTGTRDVEQLLIGDNGAVHGLRHGGLVIDMSTIDPTVTRAIAVHLEDKGVDMLDAPVSGGPQGARDASLSIMVGGSKEVLERAKPLLKCLGTTVLHMGESGAGQATKACHQLLMLITAQGVAEALTLAASCGVDVKLVKQAMMNGMASSRVLDVFGSRMVTRQFDDGIETRLYHKDLQTVLTLAHSLGVSLPAGDVVMRFLDGLIAEGNDRNDLSILVKAVERVNSTGSSA
jgi:2-hydroxy-3-oxopropionate reductase